MQGGILIVCGICLPFVMQKCAFGEENEGGGDSKTFAVRESPRTADDLVIQKNARSKFLLHSLFNSNCASNSSTNHRVVAHAKSKKSAVTTNNLQ